MNENKNRRTFLKAASGLLLSPALGLAAQPARAAANCPDVVVGTWGGDYENLLERNIGKPIIEAAGGKVTYATADQVSRMTTMRAEKNSRHGTLDVSCLADVDMYDMSRAGLLVPPEAALIPNMANIYDVFRKPYAIPHIFSAMVIVYNPAHFPTKPDSFKIATDPRLKNRVGFSDILFNFNAMTCALAAGDKTGSIDSGIKFLREVKKNRPKVYPSNETVASALKTGDIWVTCMWKARALQWQKAGLSVEYAFPTEGAIPVVFEAAVPKSSRNQACGFNYLNAMLDPRAQLGFGATMGYAPTVKNAHLPPELKASVGFSEAQIGQLVHLDYATVSAQKPGLLKYWNEDFKVGL